MDLELLQRSKQSSFIRITLRPNCNNYNENIINNLYIIILKVFTWMATEVFKPEDSQSIRKCTAESSRTQETPAIRFWLTSIWFSGELMISFIDNYVYIKNHNNIEHKHKLCLIRYAELDVVNAKKRNACQMYLEKAFFLEMYVQRQFLHSVVLSPSTHFSPSMHITYRSLMIRYKK